MTEDIHSRSLVKGFSRRIFGTIDTVTIAFFNTGNFTKAFEIGFTEVLIKMILYYLNERFRLKISRPKNITIFKKGIEEY